MSAKKTIEKLIASERSKKIGNHRVEVRPDGQRWYYYHSTPIVIHLNPGEHTGEFIIDNGGYNTRSTTANINEYKRQLGITSYGRVSRW